MWLRHKKAGQSRGREGLEAVVLMALHKEMHISPNVMSLWCG